MNESDGFKCATLTSVYIRRAACIGMAIRLSVHAAQGKGCCAPDGGEPESSVLGRMPASEV